MRKFKATKIYSLSSVGIFAFLSAVLSGCDTTDKKYECIDSYTGQVVNDNFCKNNSSSSSSGSSMIFIPNTTNNTTITQSYNSKEIPPMNRYILKPNRSTSTARSGYFSSSSANGKASGFSGKTGGG